MNDIILSHNKKGWTYHNLKVYSCKTCDNGEWYDTCKPRCICFEGEKK